MANSEKEMDCKVTVAFRNKLACKKCDIFPRPDIKVMRCASCKNILCGKCCKTKCPLCQYESKNPKCSTFIEQSELMEVLAGLKTHPCINFKNGCREEIPPKLDDLKAHDQSCIFQKVPCPMMDCNETIIFKNFDQHLKQGPGNDIEVYYDTETNEYTDLPDVFGVYKMQDGLKNLRNFYKNEKGLIYWNCFCWIIENTQHNLSQILAHSKIEEINYRKDHEKGIIHRASLFKYPHEVTDWSWSYRYGKSDWKKAKTGLRIRKGITI